MSLSVKLCCLTLPAMCSRYRIHQSEAVQIVTDAVGAKMTYLGQGSESVRDGGDKYAGLDRFGRVADVRWIKSGTDLERVRYGYDRVSNRRWRQNPVAATGQDEFYTDGVWERGPKCAIHLALPTYLTVILCRNNLNFTPKVRRSIVVKEQAPLHLVACLHRR